MIPIHAVEDKLISESNNWGTRDQINRGISEISKVFNITEDQVREIYFDLGKKMTGGY